MNTQTIDRVAQIDAAYRSLLADVAAADAERDDARFRLEALGTCTVTAAAIARDLGGAVYGYAAEDNPHATLGQLEGGHDFAVIDERFIIDWWATAYPDLEEDHPGVLDMRDRSDAARIARWYGSRTHWTRLGLVR